MHTCVCVCGQLENGVSNREIKRTLPNASDLSGQTESSSHTADLNFVTETTHNGYENTAHHSVSGMDVESNWLGVFVSMHVCTYTCRYLEEYLDSKRPMSPLSPLSDNSESTQPPSKPKPSEQHQNHTHKNRDKNRDSDVKVIQNNYLFNLPQLYYLPFCNI